MKEKAYAQIYKIKKFREGYEWETLYKVWLSLSWIFLLMGYALVIVNGTLFVKEPQMVIGLGVYMMAITIINIIPMAINVILLLALIWKEEGWYYYREYFLVSFSYVMIFILLWRASVIVL